MRKLALCLIVGAAAMPCAALAADWEYIGSTGEPGIHSPKDETWAGDRGSLRVDGVSRYLWIKVEMLPEGLQRSYVVRKSYYKIDCAKRLLRTLSRTTYDADGTVIQSENVPDLPYSAGEFIIPETMGEAVFEFACRSHTGAAM